MLRFRHFDIAVYQRCHWQCSAWLVAVLNIAQLDSSLSGTALSTGFITVRDSAQHWIHHCPGKRSALDSSLSGTALSTWFIADRDSDQHLIHRFPGQRSALDSSLSGTALSTWVIADRDSDQWTRCCQPESAVNRLPLFRINIFKSCQLKI